MPAPNVPTITLDTSSGTAITISINNQGSTVLHNNIWRSTLSEYDGQFVQITQLVAQDSAFVDGLTAHGKSYTYYAEAVGSGGTTASATAQATLDLSETTVFLVNKYLASANIVAIYGLGQYFFLVPQDQQYALAANQYVLTGATPHIGIGSIEHTQISILVRYTGPQSVHQFRGAVTNRSMCCFRDLRGNKWFGRLTMSESYQATYTDIPLTFQVCEFSESVV